ncbi:TPA: hypothetical protein R1960_000324 [Staphylococcus delphini]|nr:hypothetical protein [Staphylococcus delphini]HEC2208741.1 hypothetical protein [Staphylococcus delphini]HEC2216371.1 hypothetical protein [Staphylococcus delphini]HEC2220849.1 hypothetical protein [Staphylococcus delphini]HEC2240202.1 hypothetical protein [Staphylococcus delphini]
MNKLFKVSALSISLGLAGLIGTQVQAAEETPVAHQNSFDEHQYDRNVNLHNQYDVLRQYQKHNLNTPTVSILSASNSNFDENQYDRNVNLHNQYDVLRTI